MNFDTDDIELSLADGAIIRGSRRGSGPTVLALHGWTQSRRNWDDVGGRLVESGHEVIALDSRGHGQSTRGRLEPSVEQLRDDLRDVLDALAVDRVVLVGHSLGGATVMALAATGDHRVAGMVVVGTTACFTYPRVFLPVSKGITAAIGFGTRRGIGSDDLVGRVAARLSLGPRAPKHAIAHTHRLMVATDPAVIHQQFAQVVVADLRDRLPFIEVPMTVIGGQLDLLTPVTHTHLIARKVPHARKVVLVGCGHMVMLERGTETTAEIESMVKQVW